MAEEEQLNEFTEGKYYLNPKLIYEILKEKRVTHLHHANTVSTSLTFIRENALLSRGFVEKNGLPQTSQVSDDLDKQYGIWDDVFMDGIDIHKRYNKPNDYGPVLFVLKPEVLLMDDLVPLQVTRWNPVYWRFHPTWDKRYLLGTQEFDDKYLRGHPVAQTMFTFRAPEKTISLTEYLDHIILDRTWIVYPIKPTVGQREVGMKGYETLRAELDNIGLQHVPIKYRHHGEHYNCTCYAKYQSLLKDKPELYKKFSIKIN